MTHFTLALDLGTTTGFCIGKAEGNTISSTWDLKPGRFDGGGMRFVRFRQRLNELHEAMPIGAVYFEEVRAHKGVSAAHIYGGLMGHLTEWCETNGIPYQGVPVQAIKSFATGKGNAGKDAVIAAVREWGFEPIDDNEADAIALWRLAISGAAA